MAKKKRKNSTNNTPNSIVDCEVEGEGERDEEAPNTCEHVAKKNINMNTVRRKVIKKDRPKCEKCPTKMEEGEGGEEDDVWLCMNCAHYGCGRYRLGQHALKHFDNTNNNGEGHPLVYNCTQHIIWCYACDMKIAPASKGPIKEFLQQAGTWFKKTLLRRNNNAPVIPVSDNNNDSDVGIGAGDGMMNGKDNTVALPANITAGSNRVVTRSNDITPVKGLINLGNTCFFNSVMQCLAQTHQLRSVVEQITHDQHRVLPLRPRPPAPLSSSAADSGDSDSVLPPPCADIAYEPLDVQLDDYAGALTEALADFLRKFSAERSVNPSNLFSQVSKKAPRFRGWAQQDSHELLRYLLDGLRCEEQQRIKDSIAKAMNLSPDVKKSAVDDVTVNKAKAYFESAGRPRLDRVFGGSLLQSIECSECGHLSQQLEPFLDISVPVSGGTTVIAASTKNDDDADLNALLAEKKGPSKHQRKKEREAARRGKRNRQTSSSSNAEATFVDAATEATENGLPDDNSDSDAEMTATDSRADSNVTESSSVEGMIDRMTLMDSHSAQTMKRRRTEPLASDEKVKWTMERNLGACLAQFIAIEQLTGKNRYECERCCLAANKKIREARGEKDARSKIDSLLKTVDASKRYLVYSPPAVLTIHLKRFQQVPMGLGRVTTRKFGGRVEFPLVFDLAPFCSKHGQRLDSAQKNVLYSLYGVVSHSGDLRGGHYVAYVKARPCDPALVEYFLAAAESPDELKSTDGTVSSPAVRYNPSGGDWFHVSDSSVTKVAESKVLNAEAYILFYERFQ